MHRILTGKYSVYILWLIFFGYATCMALIFQNVIVPNMPSIQGGGKLLAHDAVHFDQVAWAVAKEIREYGWDRWHLFIDYSAPGNVSVLAALYAVWGHDPSLAVPINAMLHAFSGVLLFLICCELTAYKKLGIYAGVIAGVLFVSFPSSLSWYGQLHKDTYAIAGTLLLLFVWVYIVGRPANDIKAKSTLVYASVAVGLIGMVRPYGLTLQLVVALGITLLIIAFYARSNVIKEFSFRLFNAFIVIAVLISGVIMTKEHANKVNINQDKVLNFSHSRMSQSEGGGIEEVEYWQWQASDYIPEQIEKYIAKAARTRAHIIEHDERLGANSTMDADRIPSNTAEALAYVPRALQIATFAPFPNTWFVEKSAIKLLASVEMLVYYIFIPGIFLLLKYNRTKSVIVTLFFSISLLTILGFTVANLGTLYRMRYAYTFILIALGAIGWMYWFNEKGWLNKIKGLFYTNQIISMDKVLSDQHSDMKRKRKSAVGSGIIVMALTLAVSIGFFYRDLLMVHIFGFDTKLDMFFMALLVPMTLVTILCMPLGTAFSPVFLDYIERKTLKEAQELISNLTGLISVVLLIFCIVLAYFLPYAIPYLFVEKIQSESLYQMILFALPILLFSGILIVGNTVLNALGRAKQASSSQLVVPVIAILSIVFFGKEYGVIAVIVGMFVGQILNLVIVQFFLLHEGFSVLPMLNQVKLVFLSQLFSRYGALVAAALLTGAILLINTSLAINLGEGYASIFSVGNKVVLLILGLLSAAITSVMLPYFGAMIAQNNLLSARKELSFFLIGSTFFMIPACAILFNWSDVAIALLFDKGEFDTRALNDVTRVMQYAIVQIPFVACNLLLMKFAIATKHVLAVFIVAGIGLFVNIMATSFLITSMGVAGIALGASSAMIVSTVLLVCILFRYGHIAFVDLSILLLAWLLFITLLININFNSAPGIVVLACATIILMLSYIKMLLQRNNERYISF